MIFWLISALAGSLNLNTAELEQLDLIPGLGHAKAAAIVEHRNKNGPFLSAADLSKVSGLGLATVRLVQARVYFGKGDEALGDVPTPVASEARLPVVPSALCLNPNTATSVELSRWPGFSAIRSEAVVTEREANGPYQSCADLMRVPGIGQATLAVVAELCSTKNP